ncbi:uncharacterized protein LOC133844443 isoform X3 [Drosophila sulfurigaster albostrigata]|uniref:uncharacterized protein LOC133844443 isoform X3 n=1 Tax=Drosophila sulfurigaster albostrigata TaxID=89887 RepID=UPI002D218A90|nr:uncharacterized protein LOC133844443 isoform X3 [Drosophila sulfurigaster albostrigata]
MQTELRAKRLESEKNQEKNKTLEKATNRDTHIRWLHLKQNPYLILWATHSLLLLLLLQPPLHFAQVQHQSRYSMTSPDSNNVAEFSRRLATFSINVYNKLITQKPNQNIIFSPFSIQTCAAMARLGAVGETAAQLDRGLGLISNNEAQIAESFHKVLADYENSSILHIANKIYIMTGFELKDEFSSLISKQFLSAVEPVDFAKNVEAAGQINSWVEQRTNNLIKDLVPPSALDKDSRLVLINAIHFKGNWVHQFPERDTRNEPFHLNDADSIEVPMMNLKKRFRYANLGDLDATALELPYKDSDLSMLIVLPNSKTGLSQLEEKLRSTPLSEITGALYSTEVIVKLPKFKSELEVELSETFKQLGMTHLFSNEADFSKMLQSPEELKVSKIIHKAFIDVNEKGTEAAAATGVLTDVKTDFGIDNDRAGLLQTAFVVSYMVFAPLFGYLGDRYPRRLLMAVGVTLWSTTTILGSFMHQFGWFLTFRAMVGIGEASYSTIAPTIISDLFVGSVRSQMLALFYFAIPVGSGLGYIVGSKTAHLANNWRWALRVTPILGLIAVVLIFLIKDPKRGASEASHNLQPTSFMTDVKELVKNRSFMLSTAGFTCVAFVAGALAWWGPTYIHMGLRMQPGNEDLQLDDVSYKFGIVAMGAGLIGVPLGSVLAQRLRGRIENCDPYICAVGLFISAPMVFAALILPQTNGTMCFIFVFIAQVTLNLSWSIVADMLLYVVVPTRRSTAEAFQILISHALGDAGSPYLVGAISVAIKNHLSSEPKMISNQSFQSMSQVLENATETVTNTLKDMSLSPRVGSSEDVIKFEALQYSLFSTTFVEVLGGIFFLFTACYVIKDRRRAAQESMAKELRLAPGENKKDIFDSECLVMCTDIALRERA